MHKGETTLVRRRFIRLYQFSKQSRRTARRIGRMHHWLWLKQLHHLPGVWIVVDTKDGAVLDGSVHFRQMLALERSQFLGFPISAFSDDSVGSKWASKRFDDKIFKTQGRHEDVLLKSSDGRDVLVDVHVSHAIKMGWRSATICMIIDGTERQRLQAELIVKHKELRKAFLDLEQKSADLIRLNGEIGELSAILSRTSSLAAIGELTAELTHQLNNPLAAAISAARQLEKILEENQVAKYQSMVDLLKDSHVRLKGIMTELKRVYRSSRRSDTVPESIDLKAQLESAMVLLQQRLAMVEVRLDIEEPLPCILGKPTEIQHVLVNLIDNALQAVGSDGKLEIRVRSNDNRVCLWVGDNGPGIPPDKRERIFEPFFTTTEQGSGLGLSVVRRSIQNNKATIRVGESAMGGAEFEIGFLKES
jgi:two-component system, NtrC family, sensor kinase